MLTDYYQMSFISITIILMQIFDSLSMLFWSAASGECTSPLTANFGLVAMFLLTNSFTLDEQKGTKILKKTMPYTDNEFVLSKYLMPVLFVVFKCISDIALGIMSKFVKDMVTQRSFGRMPVPAGIAAVAVTLILLVISYRLSVKLHSKSDS